jgi:hypothetical protein
MNSGVNQFLRRKQMSERIYAVYHGATGRLVRANNRAQALSHVAQSTFNIRVASQDELVSLLGKGIKVESVRDADQNELDLSANGD